MTKYSTSGLIVIIEPDSLNFEQQKNFNNGIYEEKKTAELASCEKKKSNKNKPYICVINYRDENQRGIGSVHIILINIIFVKTRRYLCIQLTFIVFII